MELLPIALITAACVIVAYYIGKWVGEGNAFMHCARAYKCDKELFCKTVEKLIEDGHV